MYAAPISLRKLLNSEKFVYDDIFLDDLISLLASAHGHRIEVENAEVKSVTRSTVLVVLNQLNPAVGRGLGAAGMDWNRYCRDLALDGTIEPVEVDDVDIHEAFEQALVQFRKLHPEKPEATAGNIALAIIEMATRMKSGPVSRRLEEAGANLNLLPLELLKAIEAGENRVADDNAPGEDKQTTVDGARPTVWLLHYKSGDRPDPLLKQKEPGSGIEWRSTKTIDAIKPDDPVIYWRDIDSKTGDRGGLVGTGRFVGGISRSEDAVASRTKTSLTWYYYPTRFAELFPDRPLERDPLIKTTGLKINWGLGSIQKILPGQADKIDAYLISQGRMGLFPTPGSGVAPEITFIGDAPKTKDDFLKRGDLAFVLAARLNRVWDETNPESAESRMLPQGARFSQWCRRIFSGRSWSGRRRKGNAFENSFVVHIDAPWGGGKTTFANYLMHILNPYRAAGVPPDWFNELPLHDRRFWPESFRRGWHIVSFNAWQHQHLDPPWWCFYQAIRRQCFHAARTETFAGKRINPGQSEHRTDDTPPPPSPRFSFQGRVRRYLNWLALWTRELFWRVLNPKVRILLLTFSGTWIIALVLQRYDLFSPQVLKGLWQEGLQSSTSLPSVITTGLLIIFGGATAIWSIFAAFTQSLLPGTPDAAKNYALGSGDPLERFRIHFDRIVRVLKRPIVVVVDDIDRCEPRFVVELLRGIQTILRSPRVVFVLLGDRDWIEHAFANVHAAMKGIDVGPEHTFGGRFVEKAIQLSIILPDITHDGRLEYVRQLLGVAGEPSQEGKETLLEDEKKNFQQTLEDILDSPDPVNRDDRARLLRDEIHANEKIKPSNRMAFVKQVDRKLALRSASDQRVEQATQHRLVPIAPVLPANPRQIKRIINGIALFQEIARIEQEIQPGSADWCKLALWVVIMTEWPRTWATLSTYPELVDFVFKSDAEPAGTQPDDKHFREWIQAIKKNKAIMQLLEFNSDEALWGGTRIDSSTIEKFRAFMPAAGGKFLSASGETAGM